MLASLCLNKGHYNDVKIKMITIAASAYDNNC